LIEAYDRRASRLFSPKVISRRGPEDALLPSLSLIHFSNYEPAVVQTPSGQHANFVPNAHIADTPFVSTLRYLKNHNKGKENSLSKSRRNASLPAEIAAVAREAEKEEELDKGCEEEEDLERYREIDLAPMVPIMERDTTGDLIILSTPARPRDLLIDVHQSLHLSLARGERIARAYDIQLEPPQDKEVTYYAREQLQEPTKSLSRLILPLEQDTEDDADAEKSDSVSNPEQKRLILYLHQPTFVTVINMIPETLFWVTAARVARLANKVYDTMIEKLTGLEV
jgi:hypothetical protein